MNLSPDLDYTDDQKNTIAQLHAIMHPQSIAIVGASRNPRKEGSRIVQNLIDLGMQTAFGGGADFSGLDGVGVLFISQVLHKAFIEVNEEGTEAAAATAVVMKLTATPGGGGVSRTIFDCDHPFLFTIHHKETNTILFMGNVDNPTE